MAGDDDWTNPGIGYRWIKANVYGVLVLAALGLVTYGVRSALAVGDPDPRMFANAMYGVVAVLINAFGLAVFSRLTGGVLARHLPGFAVRTWVLLHVLYGLVLGGYTVASATGVLTVETDPDAVLATALTALVFGLLLGAVLGALQGLVLRKVARGVRRWIGYSTLGGAVLGLSFLLQFDGTEGGLGSELLNQLTNVVVTVITAIILLPALHRLTPHAPAESSGVPPEA